MRYKNRVKLSLDNPYSLPLLFIGLGGVGFGAYEWLLDGQCVDQFYAISFFATVVLATGLIVYWAFLLENASFCIKKWPAIFLIVLAILKIYATSVLIFGGAIDNPDLRLQAYGSSTLLALSGAVNALFFPIGYFAAPTEIIRRIVLVTFIITTAIGLIIGLSKSALFGVVFTVLYFWFLKRKETGEKFPILLVSLKTFFILGFVLGVQIILLSLAYGSDPSAVLAQLINRAMMNFDGAIYGCMVENNAVAPNSFFTYTFMSLLKRIDSSYYNLDYYSVPQWLLHEVLGIDREGRFGYPNDNIYTALYFGGLQVYSLPIFIILAVVANFFIRHCVKSWNRAKIAPPFQLAIVIFLPTAYSSIQDFSGMLLIFLLFKLFQYFFQKLHASKKLFGNDGVIYGAN